jgi:carbon storage regulator
VLVLTRRLDEGIVIQDNIVITVLAVEGDTVKLGITAPKHIPILRQELCEAVREQNLAAAQRGSPDVARSLEAARRLLQNPGP